MYFVKLYPINVELSGLDRFLWRMLFAEKNKVFAFGLGLPMPDGGDVSFQNVDGVSRFNKNCVWIPEPKKSEMVVKLKDRITEFYIRRVFYTSTKGRIPSRCAYVLYMTMQLGDIACLNYRPNGGDGENGLVEQACKETMLKVERLWQHIPKLAKTHGYCFVHFPVEFDDLETYVKLNVIFSSVTIEDRVVNFSKKELKEIKITWNRIAQL